MATSDRHTPPDAYLEPAELVQWLAIRALRSGAGDEILHGLVSLRTAVRGLASENDRWAEQADEADKRWADEHDARLRAEAEIESCRAELTLGADALENSERVLADAQSELREATRLAAEAEEVARKAEQEVAGLGKAYDQQRQSFERQTLRVKLEHEASEGELVAHVYGAMVTDHDGGRGAYVLAPQGVENGERTYGWQRSGDHEPPVVAEPWLQAVLDAAVGEWNRRGDEAQAAERAAGWSASP